MRVRARPDGPVADVAVPACVRRPGLYAEELLGAPPVQSKVARAIWDEYRRLLADARAACAGCHHFTDCLYRAVVTVDVDGYVGCTTPRERRRIRRMLGVVPPVEDLDAAAGVHVEGRPIDHESVVAMRASYPDDSLESVAERLGCSLSTVKRHLRKARQDAGAADAPRCTTVPTVDDVLDCFDAVVESDR